MVAAVGSSEDAGEVTFANIVETDVTADGEEALTVSSTFACEVEARDFLFLPGYFTGEFHGGCAALFCR